MGTCSQGYCLTGGLGSGCGVDRESKGHTMIFNLLMDGVVDFSEWASTITAPGASLGSNNNLGNVVQKGEGCARSVGIWLTFGVLVATRWPNMWKLSSHSSKSCLTLLTTSICVRASSSSACSSCLLDFMVLARH